MDNLIVASLSMLGEMLVERGLVDSSPAENTGVRFTNDVFTFNSYYWCETDEPGYNPEHETGFTHHSTGFSCSWYKHLRCSPIADEVTVDQLHEIIIDCLNSIK